jgi:hypothetical protein
MTFPRKRPRHENQSELIRLAWVAVTNSRSTAVNIAAMTIFVIFAAAALVCVVLGAHRRVVLGLQVDRAATHQLLGAAHSRAMAKRESFRNHVPCTGVASHV